MTGLLTYLSQAILPLLVFGLAAGGLLRGQDIYDDFLTGAKRGLRIAADILPTLIGLMVAVGILRASGFLDFLTILLTRVFSFLHVPAELIPIATVKLFSSSAATGLLIDLYKEYGTDSFPGFAASVMLSSTETVFYTMSVYFMSVKVKQTRYTLAGALVATLAGIAASVFFSYVYTCR